MTTPGFSDRRQERGFALLIVLWTLVLVSFVAARISSAGRTEIRVAENLAANAAAQAAVDGAVYQAIFNLADQGPEQRWLPDSKIHELEIGRTQVSLHIENEAGRVNPNLASPELLAALLRVLGGDPERAAELSEAIAEWVGRPTKPHATTTLEEYQAAGLHYLPPRASLQSLDELLRVRGMTVDLYAALLSHLTLFGPVEPDPNAADPEVAAALTLMDPNARSAPSNLDALIARIIAVGRGPEHASVTRTVVALIGSDISTHYVLLAWE